MLTTFLFDLDGTLLDLDMDAFLPRYFSVLSEKVQQVVQLVNFKDKLLDTICQMIVNDDPLRTNKEIFMEEFFKRVDVSSDVLVPVFDEFYEKDFPRLKKCSRTFSKARQLLLECFHLGLDVVIATNPVFPARAIWERLKWAGVDDFDYRLVTSYEIMHFCKPKVEYYKEILDMLGKTSDECIMIGNDPVEDMSASELGIKTFLVNDPSMRMKKTIYEPDYHGELADVLEFLKYEVQS